MEDASACRCCRAIGGLRRKGPDQMVLYGLPAAARHLEALA